MVFFFGILDPGKQHGQRAEEAPAKVPFFGGLPDLAQGAVPMTRLEQEACYLNGKAPEPEGRQDVLFGSNRN
ncbi:hypothetical protein [Devosia rhizoryzae]|uniref:Uncharacterized protein n=1 Tax=Devosia rhizoryzae TaxID=2774137 RepID=A0ABX7CA24_9HYPH|nr:hypothetical protein [Devosia rhizoryzae]QQR40109.1 hypothetical protein JI748_03600 [Devosia rhizoryzae]